MAKVTYAGKEGALIWFCIAEAVAARKEFSQGSKGKKGTVWPAGYCSLKEEQWVGG